MSDQEHDQDRIELLEHAVRALFAEVGALREELRQAAVGRPAAPPPPRPNVVRRPTMTSRPAETSRPAAPPPSPAPQPPSARAEPPDVTPPPPPIWAAVDVEALIGRYGTLALATITILLGVGAFVGWAITHHLLDPWFRVALGAVLAVAIATLGRYVRVKRSTRFGNVLLGLAVAVVHVDAWGAGPRLHLVPDVVALIVAAAASTALSVFAQFTEEEPLFAVGVGGALLAPFVTMGGQPHVIALLIYGYVVITIAMVALRESEWIIAVRLLTVGCAIYTTVGIAAALPSDSASIRLAPVAFAMAVALTALSAVPRRDRAFVTQSALGVVAVSLLFRVATSEVPVAAAAMAVIATAIAYGSVWTLPEPRIDIPTTLGLVVLPLTFLVAAMFTTERHALQAGFGLGWTLGALVIASVDAERRHAHWAVAGLTSWIGLVTGLADAEVAVRTLAMVVHAVVCTGVLRLTRGRLMAIPAVFAIGAGAIGAYNILVARPAYGVFTVPSLAAFLVSVVSVWFAWEASHLASEKGQSVLPALPLVVMGAVLLTTDSHAVQVGFALAWTLSALVMASADPARRHSHWAVAGTVSWLGILAGTAAAFPLWCAGALAAHAAICTVVMMRAQARLMAAPAILAVGAGAIIAYQQLASQPTHDALLIAAGTTFLISVVSVWFAWEASRLIWSEPKQVLPGLPLAFVLGVIYATHDPAIRLGFAFAWTLGGIVIASMDRARRQVHWAVAGTASWVGIVAATLEPHQAASTVALAMLAAVCTLVLRRARAPLMAVPAVLALVTGAAVAFSLLTARPAYGYTPFVTPASLAACAVSLAWIWFAWEGSRLMPSELKPILRLSGLVVAFVWVRFELAGAIAPDVATFLLIAYYAATGVSAVFLGRARAFPMLRHAGLALAIYAALKTVVQASSMGIGLRIGSYFVAGLFMMSVAYWYRDSAGRLVPPDAGAATGP